MSVRNILVAYNGSDGSNAALHYAGSLAGNLGHVTAYLAHSGHETVDSRAAWVPAKAREIIAEANAAIVSEIKARFQQEADGLGLGGRLHFAEETGRVDSLLAKRARTFDLLVIGEGAGQSVDEHLVIHPDKVALVSGRPVLIVPAGFSGAARHERAVVAWDGGRAVARALSDSLPLLETHGRVTVLTIGEGEPAIPADAIVAHLERHDIAVARDHIAANPGVARALVAYCKSEQPDLLVMGAYEHSKFREDFLGGVTSRVLADTPVPVLMAH